MHFDYLSIGESSNNKQFVLNLKDDFSGYCFPRACCSANAETSADLLIKYFTTFAPVLYLCSDQGSHLKNQVMGLLATSLGAKHKFSAQYVQWSNGTFEAVCRQALRIIRAFSAEFQIPESDWPKTVL